jgi:hypothetical protein
LAAAGSYGISGKAAYRDGVAEANAISAGTATGAYLAIFIGALNNNGVAGQFISTSISAVAIYNTAITAAQQLALHNATA